MNTVEGIVVSLHAQVLEAFDQGIKRPPTGRDRMRPSASGKPSWFSPRYFHVQHDGTLDDLTLDDMDKLMAAVRAEAADLVHSGEYQVTTFVGPKYIVAMACSVMEHELGIKLLDDTWRIGDRRVI